MGLVTGHERADVVAHLQSCSACCRHTARLVAVHDRLCGLIPSVEPPVGFEQRVLRHLGAAQAPGCVGMPCWARAGAVPVLVAVLVAGLVTGGFAGGWLAGTATRAAPRPATPEVAGPLMAGDRHVGDVVVSVQRPQFVSVYLHVAQPGRLTCQLLHADGSVAAIETYDASGGIGWWGMHRPDREVTTIRVSDAAGDVAGAGMLPRP